MLFKKTDVNPTNGLIPIVNFIEWAKLIGRKPVYVLWLLLPLVNIFIFCGMAVDLVRSFEKLKLADSALAVIYAPAVFFKVALTDSDKYVGQTLILEKQYADDIASAKESGDEYKYQKLEENNPYKKSGSREWVESIVFCCICGSFYSYVFS